jgi:signal transduction histidine kinase
MMLDSGRNHEEPTPPVAQPAGAATTPLGDEPMAAMARTIARLQHEINNPLAALLAEAQLLQLEPALDVEHRRAVERIIELTRRVIAGVRALDGVRQGRHD